MNHALWTPDITNYLHYLWLTPFTLAVYDLNRLLHTYLHTYLTLYLTLVHFMADKDIDIV